MTDLDEALAPGAASGMAAVKAAAERKRAEALADALDLEELAGMGAPPLPTAEEAKAAKRAAEAEKGLAPWTVGAVAKSLYARLDREADSSPMRWPGCRPGWPDLNGRDAPTLKDGDPPRGDGWRTLWNLAGPPRADWMAVLVGPTGRGKSGWALTLAEAVATGGTPVLVMSCEMGSDELLARLVALRAPDPAPAWRDVLRGAVDRGALGRAVERLEEEAPALYLWAPGSSDRTTKGLAVMVRHLALKHGKAPLVVLDYVQRLAAGDGDDRRTAVAAVSGELRDVSRPSASGDYPGCALLILSSTARANYVYFNEPADLLRSFRGGYRFDGVSSTGAEKWQYSPPVPLEGMGKESGEIEYDASLVLLLTCAPLSEDDKPSADRLGIAVVAKNRAGNTGWAPYWFDGARGRWREGAYTARKQLDDAAPRTRPETAPKGDTAKAKAEVDPPMTGLRP